MLVIEEGAEAGLVCAALARRPELHVVGVPDVAGALERIERAPGEFVLAIAGAAALRRTSGAKPGTSPTTGTPRSPPACARSTSGRSAGSPIRSWSMPWSRASFQQVRNPVQTRPVERAGGLRAHHRLRAERHRDPGLGHHLQVVGAVPDGQALFFGSTQLL